MSARRPIRVLVVDDSAVMRKVLSTGLGRDRDIEVVATATDGVIALRKVARFRPDVVTLDLEMPGMDGLEAVAAIMSERPEQRVLMLTRHARPGVLRRALKLGTRFVGPVRIGGSSTPNLTGIVGSRPYRMSCACPYPAKDASGLLPRSRLLARPWPAKHR